MGLSGSSVVITRAVEQAEELAVLLRAKGASVIVYPTIAIRRVRGEEALRVAHAVEAMQRGEYDATLVASVNAAEWLPGDLPSAVVFCVGPKTAQRVGHHAIEAQPNNSEGLLNAVRRHFGEVAGKRLLFLRAREGRREVIDGLEALGASIDAVVCYETLPLTDGPVLPAYLQVDWVTFASPSAVEAFVLRCQLPELARVACIGRTTAAAARACGLTVHAVPAVPTLEALVDIMEAY